MALRPYAYADSLNSPKVFSPEYLFLRVSLVRLPTPPLVLSIRDVQKPVLILVLLINAAHECSSRWQNLIDEDEDGLFRAELDALADDVDELADGEVAGHEVLLLVDGRDVALLYLLADHLVGIGLAPTTPGTRQQDGELTGMRSAYFWRMRAASALLFSKGCSCHA